jgi:hypothetical protein
MKFPHCAQLFRMGRNSPAGFPRKRPVTLVMRFRIGRWGNGLQGRREGARHPMCQVLETKRREPERGKSLRRLVFT